jgi:hypothetical protein
MDYVLLAIQQLLTAARDAGSSPMATVKKIIIGNRKIIPSDSLPAILIYSENVDFGNAGTAQEHQIGKVKVDLVFNAKDFYDKDTVQATENIVYSHLDMVTMVQGATSSSNHTPKTNTIVQKITNNIQLPYSGVPTASMCKLLNIDYLNEDQSNRSFPTVEANLTFEVQTVANR